MPENEKPSEAIDPVARTTKRHNLMLVAIGASAGGLSALKGLFGGLPTGRQLSYIVAQHLSPSHKSMLAELLVGNTRLRVVNVTDNIVPEVETVYITPPGHDIIMEDDRLRLVDPSAGVGPTPRVDRLFRSLASNWGEDLIGIILSGTGSDGAAGMRAIKEAGGITIVQDPSTTEYDGMPRAATQASQIDLILPAAEIGDALKSIIESPTHALPVGDSESGADRYREIVELMRRHNGIDLGQYKSGTVQRRLQRRMAMCKKVTLSEYTDYLRDNHEELKHFAADILISVTSFFRDGPVWDGLRDQLKEVVDQTNERDVIRIWIAACATGEEAYTVAMLMQEICRELKAAPDFLIFATDLDGNAVEHARYGLYSEASVAGMPSDLRDRYLIHEGKHYRVSKSLRQRMIFATQDLLRDPPFSNLHLITCRNLMIYLTPAAQRQVLGAFHYALRPGGLFMMGRSESVEGNSPLFDQLEPEHRLYRRNDNKSNYNGPGSTGRLPTISNSVGMRPRRTDAVDLGELIRQRLINEYGPASVLLDTHDNVLQLVGDMGGLLKFPEGSAEWSLYSLLDRALTGEVRAVLHRCRNEREVVRGAMWRRPIGGEDVSMRLVARPLNVQGQMDLVLLSFEVAELQPTRPADSDGDNDDDDGLEHGSAALVKELEKELVATREHLQTVVEEVETSNEELQALNEEMQSANEELQSTNEELQTSNEELQSTNEELVTVNDEMETKSRELETAANQLTNMRDSVDFPLIVLNPDLHLEQYNQAAGRLLDLDELEPRTPLHLAPWRADMEDMVAITHTVARTGEAKETTLTVGRLPRRYYRMRAMPFREGKDESRCGVILSFVDFSEEHRARASLRERESRYHALFDRNGIGTALLDANGHMREINAALSKKLGYSEAQLKQLSLFSLLPDGEAGPNLNEGAKHDGSSFEWEGRVRSMNGTWLSMVLVIAAVNEGDTPEPARFIVHFLDISSSRHFQSLAELNQQRLVLIGELCKLLADDTDWATASKLVVERLANLLPGVRISTGQLSSTGNRQLLHCESLERRHTDVEAIDVSSAEAYCTTMHRDRPVIIDNLRQTSTHAPLRELLRSTDIQAMVDQPIQRVDDGKQWFLSADASQPHEWDESELAVLRAASQLLSMVP